MQNKTTSKTPKTPRQKKMWIQARKIAAKEGGTVNPKKVSWGLVTHIYENAKKANKVPKKTDVAKAKKSKAVSRYKVNE